MATAVAENRYEAFFREFARAEHKALLLDYDGTLAPFRAERKRAVPYPGVAELLSAIMMSTGTRVVFISGRPVMELKSLLPVATTPELWGSHGLERLRMDGSYELAEIPQQAVQLLAGVDHCLEAEGLKPILEMKPGATAVHWRGLSKSLVKDIRSRLLRVWNGFQPQAMLTLREFDGGMEFRVRLKNKGDAVSQILREIGENDPVAYLGDDQTDEDAFQVLDQRGLSVLVRDQYRTTAANVWIQPPEGVLRFLEQWLQASGAEVQG